MSSDKSGGVQYAALPFRMGRKGLEVLLITSRETRRWVIPKGWPMDGRQPHETATQEALEEAGVTGDIDAAALGAFHYDKRLKSGEVRLLRVEVFALKVTGHKRVWREKHERRRSWFAAEDAAGRVNEPELAALIRSFASSPPTR